MFRALLEYILINYYSIPKGKLVDMVSLAKEKFRKLESLNLDKLRLDGNEVLHDYESKSTIEEDEVISYLLTIQALVDFVPESRRK